MTITIITSYGKNRVVRSGRAFYTMSNGTVDYSKPYSRIEDAMDAAHRKYTDDLQGFVALSDLGLEAQKGGAA